MTENRNLVTLSKNSAITGLLILCSVFMGGCGAELQSAGKSVEITSKGCLEGYVKTSQQTKISKALVTIGTNSTLTNEDGFFSLASIQSGERIVSFSKDGFVSSETKATVPEGTCSSQVYYLNEDVAVEPPMPPETIGSDVVYTPAAPIAFSNNFFIFKACVDGSDELAIDRLTGEIKIKHLNFDEVGTHSECLGEFSDAVNGVYFLDSNKLAAKNSVISNASIFTSIQIVSGRGPVTLESDDIIRFNDDDFGGSEVYEVKVYFNPK